MFLVYNSDVISETDFHVAATDRAFQYGDGLFETIRYENGQVWFWPDHYDRLSAGMAALHLTPPIGFSIDTLHNAVVDLLGVNGLTNQCTRIKLQVWRQPGGLYTPAVHDANVLITAQPGQPFAITDKTKIGVYDEVRVMYSAISRYKTLNSLPYVLAGIYRQAHGYDDVLLFNAGPERYVAECSASNLFWLSGDTLHTPALESGCVDGILRRQVLRAADALGIPTNVGLFTLDALRTAQTLFCCNVNGVSVISEQLSVSQIISQPVDRLPAITRRLFEAVLSSTYH